MNIRGKIEELRRERLQLIDQCARVKTEAQDAGRDLSSMEAAAIARWQESAASKGAKADELEKALEDSGNPNILARPDQGPWPGEPGAHPTAYKSSDVAKRGLGKVRSKWTDLYPHTGGASPVSADEFYRSIASGVATPNILAMNEGSGPSGGFLVPEQLAYAVMGPAYQQSIILPRCRTFTMTGETLKVAGLDAHSASSGLLFGGMSFGWLGEGTADTLTEPTLAKVEFKARKLAILSKASNELNEDSPVGLQLETAMAQGAPFALDYSFLRGTGAGQPRGIVNDPALIAVTKETAQDADSIVYENLTKMFARLHPSCVANSVWLAHPTTIPQLLSLVISIGIGGSQIPVMTSANGEFTILTRPVIFTELLPSIGDQGDIVLCDLTQYGVAIRKDLTIEKSGHVYFTSDETAWRGIVRCDGQGLWKSAYTPRNGDTLSWCVAIAERA